MFIFKNLAKIPIFTLPRLQLASFSRFNKAETLLKEFTPQMLQNSKNIKLLMKHTHIPGRIKRSQRGLFHKKRIQSGNRTCFSEKKSRRTWRPNIQKKRLESKILGKTLKLEVTTKMMKCMRKYGSFDNYILLTEPKNLDSIYGEYLRKLMLNKLNDPSFKIPYMNRSKKFVFKHRRSHYNMNPVVYFPSHLRDVDRNKLLLKIPANMNRDELKRYNELNILSERFEDIPTNHPMLKEMEDREEEDMRILEPDRQKVLAKLGRMKSQKKCKMLKEYNEKAEEEFLIGEEKDYLNVRKLRKLGKKGSD